ncbi:MAG: YtxH domain-containing protein, partial [Dongiaceae bacterium]
GVLFAPKSGRETRRYIVEKTNEGREYVAEQGRELYSKGRQIYEKGKEMAEDAAEEVASHGRRVVERVTSRSA